MRQEFYAPRECEADPVRQAEERAFSALGKGGGLLPLILASLFCLLLGFFVYFCAVWLSDILLLATALPPAVILVFCVILASVMILVLLLPTLIGRLRMAGLFAAGERVLAKEVFYYYTSPRAFLRGAWIGATYLFALAAPLVLAAGAFLGSFLLYTHVFVALMPTVVAAVFFVLCDLACCALLFLLVYLAGTYFAAVALAIGNESLNLLDCVTRAFAASRGKMGCIFRFVMRVVWHFLLSLVTLGVLWIMYYAHHGSVAYMSISRTLCTQDSEVD